MLIDFEVENLFSFDEPAQLSMVAAPKQRLHKHHVIPASGRHQATLLRTAMIYGANAAGKSNLIKALVLIVKLVNRGTSGTDSIECPKFKLSGDAASRPARASIAFRAAGQQYRYSLTFEADRIVRETLSFWSSDAGLKANEVLFDRVTENGETKVTFGRPMKGKTADEQQFLEFVAKGTRPNQPFLTESKDRNVQYLKPVHTWFENSVLILGPGSKPMFIEIQVKNDDAFREFLQGLLAVADTGITGVLAEVEAFENTQLPRQVKDELSRVLASKSHAFVTTGDFESGSRMLVSRDTNNELVTHQLVTLHGDGPDQVRFELKEESDGTKRLIELSAAWWELVKGKNDRVLVIDEIDRSLHPALLEMLIKLYLNFDEDRTNSQLLMTTHQTHLLDMEIVRRDEIWFANKGRSGSTELYSLADFEARHDKDIEKAYKLGRYGAIPYIGNYSGLTAGESLGDA